MKNKDLIAVAVILTTVISFGFGACYGVFVMQKNAIKAGVAHYTVNPTNGITQFEFKIQKP